MKNSINSMDYICTWKWDESDNLIELEELHNTVFTNLVG